ncbi:MAG: tetratricopeptide repeat protein [Magnetococcales bacterium]|nr:tetratricopeptide repeat protein [Magnetococcales bacterium]
MLPGWLAIGSAEGYTPESTVQSADKHDAQAQSFSAGWESLRNTIRLFGPKDPKTVAALIALADTYRATGQRAQAEPLLEGAQRILEQASRLDVALLLPLMEKSLLNHYERGHFALVLTQGDRLIALVPAALGPKHPLLDQIHLIMAHAHVGLARHLMIQPSQQAEAAAHLEQALTLFSQAPQPVPEGQALVYRLQAGLRLRNGQLAEAEALLQRALAIQEKGLSLPARFQAGLLHDMGRLLGGEGRFAQAIPYLQRARVAVSSGVTPPPPPWGEITLHLALCQMEEQQWTLAETLLQEAIAWSAKYNGSDPLAVPDMLNRLGLLYQTQGRADMARRQFDRAMTMAERYFRGHAAEFSLWRVQRDYLVPGTSRNAARQLLQESLLTTWRHPEPLPEPLHLPPVTVEIPSPSSPAILAAGMVVPPPAPLSVEKPSQEGTTQPPLSPPEREKTAEQEKKPANQPPPSPPEREKTAEQEREEQTPPPVTPTEKAEKSPAVSSSVAPTNAHASPPVEKGTATKQERTAPEKPPPIRRGGFLVALGCFSDSEYLEEAQRQVAPLKLPTFRRDVNIERKGLLTCIYGGPFDTESQAEQGARLARERAGIRDAVVRPVR